MSELKPCPDGGHCQNEYLIECLEESCEGFRRKNKLLSEELENLRSANMQILEAAVVARVSELEVIIIEADAQFNTDKKPADIESASLSLVRMCSYGREAMDRVAELETALRTALFPQPPKPEVGE